MGRCFYTNSNGGVCQLNGPGNTMGTSFSLSPISWPAGSRASSFRAWFAGFIRCARIQC